MSVLLSAIMQAADCKIILEQDEFGLITISYDDAGGSFVSTTESVTVPEGTNIFISVKLKNKDYALDKVYINGEEATYVSSYRVMEDITISASYVKRALCDITILPYSHGSVSISYIDTYDMGTYQWEEGMQVYSHSLLFIEAVPDDGYKLASIKINGNEFNGSSYTLIESVDIEVVFEQERSPGLFDYKVWTEYDPELGDVIITDREGNSYVDGDEVYEDTYLTIKVFAKENSILESVIINDEDHTEEMLSDGRVSLTVKKDVFVKAVFRDKGAVDFNEKKSGISFEDDGTLLYDGDVAEEIAVYGVNGMLESVTKDSNRCDISRLTAGYHVVVVKTQKKNEVFKIYR